MPADVAIKVDKVHKDFRLPHEKAATLKSTLINILKGKQNRAVTTQHALKNISFEIKQGEFFGIVGRNGSGKSTLLKILAGIYQPTKGSVHVNGKLVPFIELGVGFNPELTGRENVYLNGALLGFSKAEIDGMYDDIVGFAELEQFMDQKLKNYSSGMQVRLAFSMAIRAQADVLLVDEVLAVGDADFQRKCFDYFRQLKRDKKTVVFVSHDMNAVQQYCDTAILLDNSELVFSGRPAVVASKYNRLFVQGKENKDIAKANNGKKSPSGEDRWGDGSARLTSVEAMISADNKEIIIEAECEALDDIENPIFGFSIKNQLLQQLMGTNTVRKNIQLQPIKKGEKRKIKWTFQNILNEGVHYVDCTVSHDESTSVADRWPDAATIKVYRDESNPYIVYNPDITFSMDKAKQ